MPEACDECGMPHNGGQDHADECSVGTRRYLDSVFGARPIPSVATHKWLAVVSNYMDDTTRPVDEELSDTQDEAMVKAQSVCRSMEGDVAGAWRIAVS